MANGAEVARTGDLPQTDARARRAAAFRELADRHLEASYRLARAILDDPVEAEDATHDAFETAWKAWDSLRDPERFERWFDRIIVNTCRNRLRRRRALSFVAFVPEISGEPVERDVASSQAVDRDTLERAIARLGVDQRLVVALRFYRDMSVDDIAARTGVPVGTVKSRLHYAMTALRLAVGQPAED
jgi:RNA polymerase sigma-70 factor (ECF subfamily)